MHSVLDCLQCDELLLSLTDEQYAQCKNQSSLEGVFQAALASAGIELMEYGVGTISHFPSEHRMRLVSKQWVSQRAR